MSLSLLSLVTFYNVIVFYNHLTIIVWFHTVPIQDCHKSNNNETIMLSKVEHIMFVYA